MYFIRANNQKLKQATQGGFPQNLPEWKMNHHHPGYITRSLGNSIFSVCPCSTKNWQNLPERRFIEQNTCTSTGNIFVARTYLGEEHSFPVTDMNDIAELSGPAGTPKIAFWGLVAPEDVI